MPRSSSASAARNWRSLASVPAYGQDKPLTAQQRMKDRNAQVKTRSLSGEERLIQVPGHTPRHSRGATG